MGMDRITYDHFFIETKHHLSKNLIEQLNPHQACTYFKLKNTYISLWQPKTDTIEVVMVCSTAKSNWLHAFKQEMLHQNIKYVQFSTTIDNIKMQSLVKYCNHEVLSIREGFMPDGGDLITYKLDLTNLR